MNIGELIEAFARPPEPWREGRTIPWDDPGFSRRMLAEHLSQLHDGASRRSELIDAHVEFIERAVLDRPASRLLDLGCGPGLYCLRLAKHEHDCTGIDFSPASIAYAREQALDQGLRCGFELGDIRSTPFAGSFDLVMLLYGELNLFPQQDIVALLRRCAEALSPGGKLLLEVHSYEAVRQRGLAHPRWSAVSAGLFSDKPHLRLDQSFWLEQSEHAAGRHWIVDAASGEVSLYGWTMKAYYPTAYETLLHEAGLRITARYENLAGSAEAGDFPVLLAMRE